MVGVFSDKYCTFCGCKHKKNDTRCPSCDRALGNNKYGEMQRLGAGGVGYSDRTDDPSFKRFQGANKKAGFIFFIVVSLIIGVVVVSQGAKPMVAAGVVLIIWVFDSIWYVLSLIPKKDWEGEVVGKRTFERTVRKNGDDGVDRHETVYEITFKTDAGKKKKIEDGVFHHKYDYFNVGDRVRFIGKLRNYEKYDKSQDDVIICAGCEELRDPRDTYCGRCGCIILKRN
ncbi:MAG: DUF2500 domain-containing protein [Lachnospiraceae bacterium]|nr:DUF2500 domain-containing protein [Lachnospiraceae bacterium]